MLSESLIIGLVVLLLCSAMSFYMYVRIMFLEKKVTVMESILVDMRVALDSIMMDHGQQHAPIPISATPGAQISEPAPLDASETEVVPEESFYSSVLEQAHEKEEGEEQEEGVTAEKALKSFDEAVAEVGMEDIAEAPAARASAEPNLDSMTRQELAALAEKRGLRVKRSLNRGEVLSLLRRSSPLQNAGSSTGTENVSGSTGSANQAGASLDGSVPVDFGKNGASLD